MLVFTLFSIFREMAKCCKENHAVLTIEFDDYINIYQAFLNCTNLTV